MDSDEKFHQRWEFRRKEVDGDSSSDDDRSNTSGPSAVKRRNIVTDLVLLEDDEASDHPECERRKMNPETEEVVMFEGLKDFSESLIHELAVSRENMFAHMRVEMRELVARGMSRKKPNVKKKKTHERKGVVKPYKNAKNDPRVLEEATKNEKGVPKTAHMNFDEQVVSSPYLTLPTVISKAQFQNPSNHYLPSNGHIHVTNNSNPQRDIRRLIDGTKFGSFSHKSVGLFGQSCPQTASIPFLDYGSNISSLTYCESPFVASEKMVLGTNGVVRLPPSAQRFQHSNRAHKSDGELGSLRPQEVKDGNFYSTSLRNHR